MRKKITTVSSKVKVPSLAPLVVVRLVYVREQIAFRMGVDLVETALDEVVEELVAGAQIGMFRAFGGGDQRR
ncbi:MAG: hypothetical protein E6G39_04995 [Actinobacteria bacterium]|nr:MAG: hypothetical protein E6G39_04995 [Actinomycetota bacterium]